MTGKDDNTAAPPSRNLKWLAFIPVAIFAVLAAIFAKGLTGGDRSTVPSVLIGKPARNSNFNRLKD